MKNPEQLKIFLDKKVAEYNHIDFIENDPVSIPHLFCKKQDIEVAALFAAVFAWGQRTTIIKKARELMCLFDNAPYDFVMNFSENDLKRLRHFRHRTFNFADLKYFLQFLQMHYHRAESLEDAFFPEKNIADVKDALNYFQRYFFSLDTLEPRTRKHIASPAQNATCKRLNMLLRWMIRHDSNGVDFGFWKKIKPSQLYCPLDLHVNKVARVLGLIKRKQNDWHTVEELTQNLKKLDTEDPVKYDFALFGLSISGYFR
jgi:uncharacterized protein (TIGR02757 family)